MGYSSEWPFFCPKDHSRKIKMTTKLESLSRADVKFIRVTKGVYDYFRPAMAYHVFEKVAITPFGVHSRIKLLDGKIEVQQGARLERIDTDCIIRVFKGTYFKDKKAK